MVQTYTAFMKSRAKKPKAEKVDPVAAMVVKKPKKKFQEYTEGWGLPPKKRRKRSATDLSDPTGGVDEIIKSTGTVGSTLGKKKEQTTRIRRTREPGTGVPPFRNAAKRRKKRLLEI